MASSVYRTSSNGKLILGNKDNFWLWSESEGYDLTHPDSPDAEPGHSRLKLYTTNSPITIDPKKTALVIIDMQNYFLSPVLGRSSAEAQRVETVLLDTAIPAARKAGIQIIWLNWGLTEETLNEIPPTPLRSFKMQFTRGDGEILEPGKAPTGPGRDDRLGPNGFGHDIGTVVFEDGSSVEAGRVLMMDTWNADLLSSLKQFYQESLDTGLPDTVFHKSRHSGLWQPACPFSDFLRSRGIRTLLFTGINTDQCVLGTLQDAMYKGWDCILLRDGCATYSPDYARQTSEFNCEKTWGFVSTCGQLAKGAASRV